MLLIRYTNGKILQGALLAVGDQKIRVALKDSDDVTEYRLVSHRWVSEDCEIVTIVTIALADERFPMVGEEEFLESIVPAGFDRPVAGHLM